MSKDYCEKTGKNSSPTTPAELRVHCQRPGRQDEDGKPIYFTEQNHKKECDINNIIKKYDKTGLISHISRFEAKFGDLTGLDFKTMQDAVKGAQSSFNALPPDIRNRFENDPGKLLAFMEDPKNRQEGIELGIISAEMAENLDGFGEHVKQPIENIEEKEEK